MRRDRGLHREQTEKNLYMNVEEQKLKAGSGN